MEYFFTFPLAPLLDFLMARSSKRLRQKGPERKSVRLSTDSKSPAESPKAKASITPKKAVKKAKTIEGKTTKAKVAKKEPTTKVTKVSKQNTK